VREDGVYCGTRSWVTRCEGCSLSSVRVHWVADLVSALFRPRAAIARRATRGFYCFCSCLFLSAKGPRFLCRAGDACFFCFLGLGLLLAVFSTFPQRYSTLCSISLIYRCICWPSVYLHCICFRGGSSGGGLFFTKIGGGGS